MKRRHREYEVVVTKEGNGYWVLVPALPGCYTQGETIAEVMACAKDAIETHLEALREDGQAIPVDEVVSIRTVKVAV